MNIELKVQNRSKTGKSYARKLRAQNLIPGVIYAKGEENINISMDPLGILQGIQGSGNFSSYKAGPGRKRDSCPDPRSSD